MLRERYRQFADKVESGPLAEKWKEALAQEPDDRSETEDESDDDEEENWSDFYSHDSELDDMIDDSKVQDKNWREALNQLKANKAYAFANLQSKPGNKPEKKPEGKPETKRKPEPDQQMPSTSGTQKRPKLTKKLDYSSDSD